MNGRPDLLLQDNSRIAIVGAGPAGCFFAWFALEAAARRGISLQVVLYDGKAFGRGGPAGCNMCAGVLAATFVDKLEGMGLHLPPGVVQRRVERYRLVTPEGTVDLDPPEGSGHIYTVFRGMGPRDMPPGQATSLDDHLLAHVRARGAGYVPDMVADVTMSAEADALPRLRLGSGAEHEADLVVCAFGMHSPLLRRLPELIPGYVPPPTTPAYQMELRLGAEHVDRVLGGTVHVFALGTKGIIFAALTPKREHVTVTLVGDAVGPGAMTAFLANPLVARYLPNGWSPPPGHCHCRPRLPFGPAKHPYADRLVVVGDASSARLYKNGLESAYVTGRAAAETAVIGGISADTFQRDYDPVCRAIARDSAAGRRLFWIKDSLFNRRPLSTMLVRVVQQEQACDPPAKRVISRALWGVFTGDQAYSAILRSAMRPSVQAKFWVNGLLALWRGKAAGDEDQVSCDGGPGSAPPKGGVL